MTDDYLATQIDFSNTTQVKYADLSRSNTYLSGVVAVDDNHVIMGGFDVGGTPHKYFFAKYNFSQSLPDWAVESAAVENDYALPFTRVMFSFLNDDSNRLINIMQIQLLPIVIVLNPADGTLIDAKKIDYNLTYSFAQINACGKVSNNMAIVFFTGITPNVSPLTFINTETWELTSYISTVYIFGAGFTPLFNTDQIVMLLRTIPLDYLTLQAAYDKLNATEFFNATTYTLTDINGSLAFTTPMGVSFSEQNHSITPLTPTVSDLALSTNSSLTYEVTANIFSSNVATLEADITSSSLGPVEFDCYSVTTSASNADFSNQLSMTQSDGQAIPSWMSFDSATGSISLSSPEISSGNYTVTNSLTGVAVNFTLDTNVTINIVEASSNDDDQDGDDTDDDDHCLGASSEGLCAFFAILIVAGIIIPIVFVALVVYFKCRPKGDTSGMIKISQAQPAEGNEGNEGNKNFENDESAHMNQHRRALQNVENGTIQHAEDDGQDNKV